MTATERIIRDVSCNSTSYEEKNREIERPESGLHRFRLLAGIEAASPPRTDDVSFIAEPVEKAINLMEWHEWAK